MRTLDESRLYLGDNGRCFCGALRCAGASAYYSGRTISGQEVQRIEWDTLLDAGEDPDVFKCDGCGKGLSPVVRP